MNEENKRLQDPSWKNWGPYLSERQWGTVREDYSAEGTAWEFSTHETARSKAWRWGEDGLGGLGDQHLHLCISVSLWNTKDPILKERLFGLGGNEGNHGEDVKELYYFLDATPTHSYLKMLYKYPQQEYPYENLVEENKRRGRLDPNMKFRIPAFLMAISILTFLLNMQNRLLKIFCRRLRYITGVLKPRPSTFYPISGSEIPGTGVIQQISPLWRE